MSEAGLPPAAVASLANELRLACMRIARRVRYENADTIAPHRFSVLSRLEDDPKTPSELATIEKVSAPSMTRTISTLADLGYVERAPHPEDGRQVIVSITSAGKQVLHEVRKRRDAWMSVRVSKLTPHEQQVLREASAILAKVAAQ